MPRALIGHCMAPLNYNEVVIAAGFSPETNDYFDSIDIYEINTNTWYTKDWSKLQFGPRIDASCYGTFINYVTREFWRFLTPVSRKSIEWSNSF